MKNIKMLGDKPLIGHMIEATLGANYLDRVIVSTDHEEIKTIAEKFGAEVPFIRPDNLSWDCPSEWVTQHAVDFVEEEGYRVDIAVTLQPTTPFVTSIDIDGCINILTSTPEFDSVFTASTVRERPEWMFTVDVDTQRAELINDAPIRGMQGVTQSLPLLVIPNGAAYATRRNTLMEEDRIIAEDTGIWLMPFERSIDIDELIDFQFAEFILSGGSR
jgi:CMP-N-acetylneuraminic acid synthetase